MFEARYTIVAETVANARRVVLSMQTLAAEVKEQAQRAHEASLKLQPHSTERLDAELAGVLGLESVASPHSAAAEERATKRCNHASFNRCVDRVLKMLEELRWVTHALSLTAAGDRAAAGTNSVSRQWLENQYQVLRSLWLDALAAACVAEQARLTARMTKSICELKGIGAKQSTRQFAFLTD